jgi:hypothetical protein
MISLLHTGRSEREREGNFSGSAGKRGGYIGTDTYINIK